MENGYVFPALILGSDPRRQAVKGLKGDSPGVQFHHFLEMTTRSRCRISRRAADNLVTQRKLHSISDIFTPFHCCGCGFLILYLCIKFQVDCNHLDVLKMVSFNFFALFHYKIIRYSLLLSPDSPKSGP